MATYLFSTETDWVVTIVRLILGIIFLAHGSQKLLGWFGGAGPKKTVEIFRTYLGVPAPLTYLTIFTELFGGLGLILGLLSRLDALGIMAIMLVAIAKSHWRHGLFMNWAGNQQGEGFEYHLLAIAAALIVLVRGGGVAALDSFFVL